MKFKKIGIVLITVLFVGVACLVPCFAAWDYSNESDLISHELQIIDCDFYGNVDIEAYFDGSYPNIVLNSTLTIYRNDLVPNSYISFSINNFNDFDVYVRVNVAPRFSLWVDNVDIGGDFVDSGYVVHIDPDGADYGYADFRLFCDDDSFESADQFNLLTFYFSDNPIFDEDFTVYDPSSLIGIVGNIGTLIFSSPILIVLFFIGVSCSLGFVAVKVIRKVIWGN